MRATWTLERPTHLRGASSHEKSPYRMVGAFLVSENLGSLFLGQTQYSVHYRAISQLTIYYYLIGAGC